MIKPRNVSFMFDEYLCSKCNMFDCNIEDVRYVDVDDAKTTEYTISCTHTDACKRAYKLGKGDKRNEH